MNLEELTDAVWQRLQEHRPRALLIGEAPDWTAPYQWVQEPPYEAVVLGLLSPGVLLSMPSDPVCRALLENIPVYLWPHQRYREAKAARMLCRELAAREQHLRQLGVRPLSGQGKLITAQEARQLREQGLCLPSGCRLTPLARDIWEEAP